MVAKYYEKNKEMQKRKSHEHNRNFSSREENKKRECARNQSRKLFTESELREDEKN